MPVTLPLKTHQYVDPDAHQIVTSLPIVGGGLGASELNIGFLRRFFRNQDTQALMKIFKRLYMVECRRISPLTRAAVGIAAKVYGNIRDSSENPLVRELLQIMAKPHFQALLYSHDKIGCREYFPHLALTPEPEEDEETVKVVQLIKSNEPLGATLNYNDTTGALQVARILHGGAADRSGLLHVGDEVNEVAGMSVRGRNPDDVVQMLSQMVGPISLTLVSGEDAGVPLRESKMRVRAFFDYNPATDALNPCPEAGLAFKRGDVLHIVSQEDPWWWQAKKEGETTGRAGLIPARALQERNELVRRAESDEDVSSCGTPGSRHTSPCRISPKIARSRRVRKTMYQAQNSGGSPTKYKSRGRSTPIADFDTDDIPTYEEVELYKPPIGQCRPIILVGPPGVGRNELKRRLMAADPDHFEEVVPYTSRPKKSYEIDGREYHFVPREEMERAILGQRFVEFGEFKGNLYGTTLSSIKTVINSGKVCVLCPHTQALKFLRTSDIKPYIIYIRPPPLGVLRDTRRAHRAMVTLDGGYAKIFQEEDFIEMIEIGRRIEEKYGHYFDAGLVNNDMVKASKELRKIIDRAQQQPQWVPVTWVD